ncbi:MAG: hypothetical protein AAGA77_14275 [Bacteroidota bacterium]
MYHSKILLADPPRDEREKDKWLWVQGRKLYFLKNLIVVLVIIIGLFLLLDYETFSKTDYFQFLPYILFAIGCELLANLFVVFIYKNPKLLMSGVFTGIGSAFKVIGVLSGTLLLFGLILRNKNILTLLILFLLLPNFVRYIKWLLGPYRREQLNTIQESVVKFVNPSKFLGVLRSELKIIKDKSEAIELLQKLKKKKKYGVEVALLEELTILHTNKRHWIITFLIGLSIFILGAIGEGFFQDIIYEPLKNLMNK